MRRRRREEIATVVELWRGGHRKRRIAQLTAIPRSTVRDWIRRRAGVAQPAEATDLKSVQWGFESLHQHQFPAYVYLLGMYLGDGYIARYPRAYVLRIFLHRNQRDIAERVGRAINTLLPRNRVGVVDHHGSAVAVTTYSQAWPALFPQHGSGRKHTRRIALEPWQRNLVSLQLFAWACDLLGVRCRRSNQVTISIARRPDVGRLDAIMGWGP